MLLCPICKKNSSEQYRPFCSSKCKQIDLLNWLNEDYKIPISESEVNNEDKEKY